MHTFDFTFDFNGWTDEQINRLIDLLGETGDYENQQLLVDYTYPVREKSLHNST